MFLYKETSPPAGLLRSDFIIQTLASYYQHIEGHTDLKNFKGICALKTYYKDDPIGAIALAAAAVGLDLHITSRLLTLFRSNEDTDCGQMVMLQLRTKKPRFETVQRLNSAPPLGVVPSMNTSMYSSTNFLLTQYTQSARMRWQPRKRSRVGFPNAPQPQLLSRVNLLALLAVAPVSLMHRSGMCRSHW